MSLIAHFPLNGNFNDYSGYSRTLTTSGTITENNSGKIGKTYDFSSGRLELNYKSYGIDLTKSSSVTCWVKINSLPSSRMGIFETKYGAEYAVNIASDGHIQWYYGSSGTSSTPYSHSSTSGTFNFQINVWTHLAFVRNHDKNTMYIYVNGELKNTHTMNHVIVVSNSTFKIGYSYTGQLKGYINDFRIYDHALSVKEVKEIYKSLILHYPLDSEIKPTQNLIEDPNFKKINKELNLFNLSSGITKISDEWSFQVHPFSDVHPETGLKYNKYEGYFGKGCLQMEQRPGGNYETQIFFRKTIALDPSKTYVVSAYVKCTRANTVRLHMSTVENGVSS